jgi:hypothetical protein
VDNNPVDLNALSYSNVIALAAFRSSPHVHVPADILWSSIVSNFCFLDANYVDMHVSIIKAFDNNYRKPLFRKVYYLLRIICADTLI